MNLRQKSVLMFAALVFTNAAARGEDLPEGAAKAIVQRMCKGCHPVTTITKKRASKEKWGVIVDRMVTLGAVGTDDEIDSVIEYLAANFSDKKERVTGRSAAPARRAAR
jgi:hypothetical protein